MLLIQTPPTVMAFASKWADHVYTTIRQLPRYSRERMAIENMIASVNYSLKLYDRSPKPDTFHIDLPITIAKVADKYLKQGVSFEVDLTVKRNENNYVLAPKNLPTLILLHGKDEVPKTLTLKGKYRSSGYLYMFNSPEDYSISELV